MLLIIQICPCLHPREVPFALSHVITGVTRLSLEVLFSILVLISYMPQFICFRIVVYADNLKIFRAMKSAKDGKLL
jgi:hypothetical protein